MIFFFFLQQRNRKPRNLMSLKKEEKIDFINSFDLVLSDCDGE